MAQPQLLSNFWGWTPDAVRPAIPPVPVVSPKVLRRNLEDMQDESSSSGSESEEEEYPEERVPRASAFEALAQAARELLSTPESSSDEEKREASVEVEREVEREASVVVEREVEREVSVVVEREVEREASVEVEREVEREVSVVVERENSVGVVVERVARPFGTESVSSPESLVSGSGTGYSVSTPPSSSSSSESTVSPASSVTVYSSDAPSSVSPVNAPPSVSGTPGSPSVSGSGTPVSGSPSVSESGTPFSPSVSGSGTSSTSWALSEDGSGEDASPLDPQSPNDAVLTPDEFWATLMTPLVDVYTGVFDHGEPSAPLVDVPAKVFDHWEPAVVSPPPLKRARVAGPVVLRTGRVSRPPTRLME